MTQVLTRRRPTGPQVFCYTGEDVVEGGPRVFGSASVPYSRQRYLNGLLFYPPSDN